MLYLSFLVFFMHVVGLDAERIADQTPVEDSTSEGDEESYKRAITRVDRNAFSNDFDTCMIHNWTRLGVLQTSPTVFCNSSKHFRLCYGLPARRPYDAQFISCYNNETLIPEFTAHVVPYSATVATGRGSNNWYVDNGGVAPRPQATVGDCNPAHQTAIHTSWSQARNFFCSRGHLTPNGAFNTIDERGLTFIVTNTAPQWQQFNAGNWGAVEGAVKNYVNAVLREVYVFTGTAGNPTYWTWGWRWIPIWKEPYKAGNVIVPKYFWKAVCDPVARESIVFVAENNVGVMSPDQERRDTCLSQPMTKANGVVKCYSLAQAKADFGGRGFLFPDFDPINCDITNRGPFLDPHLNFT